MAAGDTSIGSTPPLALAEKKSYFSVVTNMELLLRFSWDETKNERNLRKHGVSFEVARLVFEDPWHISRHDRIEAGEERWQTIGIAGGVALLLVAHTWGEAETGEEQVSIVSARCATKLERRIYEQAT